MNVSSLLELPELGRIRRTQTVYGESPLSAHAALALLESPWGKHARDAGMSIPYAVIRDTLGRWVQDVVDQDETITPLVKHSVFDIRAVYYEDDEGAMHVELHSLSAPSGMRQRYIAQRLRQAEQFRGLGQSALVALSRAADVGLPILLPETLQVLAGDRTHLKGRLKTFPSWLLDPQPMDKGTIEGLANPRRTRFTGRLARAVIALDAAVVAARDRDRPKLYTITSWPLTLTWEPQNWNTVFRHIVDDFQREHESSQLFAFSAKPGPKLAPGLHRFMDSLAAMAPVHTAVARVVRELTAGKGRDDD